MELQRITIWLIIGTILLIQTSLALDNSGGGTWQENITFYLKSATAEYGHYKIVIDESACKIYNVMGDSEACLPNGNFWDLVQSDGEDIRVYNQSAQLYFWIEEFDYANKTAVIWVNLSAGSEELNFAYGNPSATKSDYENGRQVFEFFDDFEGNSLDTNKWQVLSGTVSVNNGVAVADGGSSFESIQSFSRDIIINTVIRVTGQDSDGYYTFNSPCFSTGSSAYFLYRSTWHGYYRLYYYDGNTHNILVEREGYEPDVNIWYHAYLKLTGNDVYGQIGDDAPVLSATESTIQTGKVKMSCQSPYEVDWVFVAKLADPADFYTQGGEPETNTTHIVSFKVYRCFKPVKNVPVKVKYNGKLVCCGYTDDTGSIAFRLDKLKTYEIDINKSEKIVTIQPLENNYIITLPCNLSQEWEEATYNVTTGSYPWDLLTTAQNLSSQLSPSAKGFLSGLVAWLAMYGVSAVGVNAAPVGVIALVGLAVVGLADWVAVLLCCVFMVAMYVLRRGIG